MVIPALFGSGPLNQKLDIPALETLLARAEPLPRVGAHSYEADMFNLFGIKSDPANDLPIAAVTRLVDTGHKDSGWWLRADPVHLQIQGDRVVMTDYRSLAISRDEAQALIQEVLNVFIVDDWYLEALHPNRWYLKLNAIPRIKTCALPMVMGKEVSQFFPTGKDAPNWRAILNEIQMLLYASPVNAQREAEGSLPINSLWFWGGGRLPELGASGWTQVWSDEPISLGLARLAGTAISRVPANGQDWLRQAITPGRHLLILDDTSNVIEQRDTVAWKELMEHLDGAWIKPLFMGLKNKELSSIAISDATGNVFTATSGDARRWWRRRRPLENFRINHAVIE